MEAAKNRLISSREIANCAKYAYAMHASVCVYFKTQLDLIRESVGLDVLATSLSTDQPNTDWAALLSIVVISCTKLPMIWLCSSSLV